MAGHKNHRAEVYEATDGWRWRLRSHTGRIVADGAEAYTSKGNAKRGLERVLMVISDGHYEIVEGS